MRVVIAGGHGKIAQHIHRLLVGRGDNPVGIVRNPAHEATLIALGVEPVLLDLEGASVAAVTDLLAGADGAVFAAGAGPGSGAARKDTVDNAAAVLFADAAKQAGVRRHIQISAMGLSRAEEPTTEPVFAAYLRAKASAERHLREQSELDWTILRPGRLTDEPATGRVRLAESVDYGEVPRADVADVVVALLGASRSIGRTLELVGGQVPVVEAIAEC